MATTTKIVNGKLEIVETKDTVTTTMTEDEVTGKITEIQTAIDHLEIDLAAKEAEKAIWVAILDELKK